MFIPVPTDDPLTPELRDREWRMFRDEATTHRPSGQLVPRLHRRNLPLKTCHRRLHSLHLPRRQHLYSRISGHTLEEDSVLCIVLLERGRGDKGGVPLTLAS